MKNTPSLGTLPINLPALMETRMLIQANSGGGKSWGLRRVIEQTAPLVQQLVIDPEGEFASLREKFDYIICAPHGADAVANPATAAALARALWESGTSAILDIYDLKSHERVLFVRRFCEALINAPKAIWHPTMVVIDEIHMFAPQTGSAESLAAVTDLATRGRKRGLALVAATQRLSKFHKDVAAELLNKMIGRTGLDVDVQRAADDLGMNKADARQLRDLDPGEWFVYGPALDKSVTRTKIGPVVTTHPKMGARGMLAPPPASAAVLAGLQKIEGLQRRAEDEVKTIDSLSAEVATLKRKLTIAEKPAAPGVPEAEVQRRIRETLASAAGKDDAAPMMTALRQELEAATRGRDGLQLVLNGWHDRARRIAGMLLEGVGDVALGTKAPEKFATAAARNAVRAQQPTAAPTPGPVAGGLTGPEQRILDAVAWMEGIGVNDPEQPAVAFLAGYSANGGAYNNPRGRLKAQGLVDYLPGSRIALTDAGRALANKPPAVTSNEDLHQRVLARLSGPEQRLLLPLLACYPASMTNADLAAAAGYTPNAGAYNNPRGRLRGLGLVDYPQAGSVAARALLFPKGKP